MTTRRYIGATRQQQQQLSVAVTDDSDAITDDNEATQRTWNIAGLLKEVPRLTARCHKKIGKARQRLEKAQEEVERLMTDPQASLEELEQCPNISALETELQELQARLQNLNKLEVLLVELRSAKGKNATLPLHVAELVVQLDVHDEPLEPTSKSSKKEKGPRNMEAFRLPFPSDGYKQVGKQAEDNDELSLSPKHRDSADWWMHASGCPGSHVIIRCHDQNPDKEVVLDAAALAARQSKCTGNTIKVSMVRARDVKKPPGAKAGLVMLNGDVRTITVNMKEAQERLDRLDATVLIN